MPHLTQQISIGGPVVEVVIGVSLPRRKVLEAQKIKVPLPIQIRALVDTGASCTCIDPSVLSSLQLTRTGLTPMHSPTTGGIPAQTNLFDVSIVLINPKLSYTLQIVRVAETMLELQGIKGLIGREVLENCLLVYDGQHKIFTLAF